jgi:predicted ATPase
MEEAAIWRSTASAMPAAYFPAETSPLLERFCVHVARARLVEEMASELDLTASGSLVNYDTLARMSRAETAAVAALARSLRLTTQARLRSETAHNQAASHAAKLDARRPWADTGSTILEKTT